jgi:hypothetical protein
LGNTRRVWSGIVILGAVLAGTGSPALAAHDRPGPAPRTPAPATSITTPPTVEIGSAAQWVRLPDGTIQRAS